MKTLREIQVEAQQIDELARRHWEEWRGRIVHAPPTVEPLGVPANRVLFNFPLSRRTSHRLVDGATEPHTHLTWRWIEGGFSKSQREYYLVQEWAETTPSRGTVDQVDAFVDSTSLSLEELLAEGYKQVEEDVLAERLTPVIDRVGRGIWADNAVTVISEIEAIIELGKLSPAKQIRTKSEIRAFLAGRMEAVDFIEAAINRQYRREPMRETMGERRDQRLSIGTP